MKILALVLFTLAFSSTSGLKVLSPSSIQGEFQHTNADFGAPAYGGSLTGRLIYGTPGNHDACKPIDPNLNPDWPKDGQEAIVLLVDRHNCTFVTKVRNAQEAGVQAVVVADNIDEPLFIMAGGDGAGGISIPSVLITKNSGNRLKTALGYKPPNYEEKDETVTDHVIVTIEWKLPNPDNRVEWTLWSTSLDTRSRQFKINFASTAIELQKHKHVYYEPHYITWICRNCYPFDDSVHTTLCTHNGKYCAPDPDDDLEHGISGQDIVNENLRQICIFRNTNETEDYKKFWDYVQNFASDCTPDETDVGNTGKFNEECSISVQKKVGLDPAKTKNCIEASECREANQKIHLHNKEFICSSNNENVLLRQEQEQQGVDRIFILPTMIINGEQYRGDLARSSVLRAICAGFVPGTKPSTCFSPRVGGLQYVVKGAGFNNVNGIYTQISEDDVQLTSFVGTDKTNKENNYFVIRFHDGQWKIEDGSDVYYFNKNEAEFPPESGWQPGEKAKNTVAPKVHTYVPEKDKEVVHKESNQTTMIIVVIAVVVIAIASVLFYRRRLRSEMRQEVRSILAEYMPLTDVDSEEYRKGSSQLI